MSVEHPLGTAAYLTSKVEGRHPGVVSIMAYFAWAHLPASLQNVSRECADLALAIVVRTDDGPELVAGLRKLLEAKDCFVRAHVGDLK